MAIPTVTDTSGNHFVPRRGRPNASNVNWAAGETQPNLATTKVGDGGGVIICSRFRVGPT